jgi:hypothetical protein
MSALRDAPFFSRGFTCVRSGAYDSGFDKLCFAPAKQIRKIPTVEKPEAFDPHQNRMLNHGISQPSLLFYIFRTPSDPSPPPIKEPPSPPENPDAPVGEPDPEEPAQI